MTMPNAFRPIHHFLLGTSISIRHIQNSFSAPPFATTASVATSNAYSDHSGVTNATSSSQP